MKLYSTQNYYLLELREIFAHNFLEECARLAEQKPWMGSTAIERMAESIVTKAMYYDQRDELKKYWRAAYWRADLK